MKAVIMAGGYGERLRPYTEKIPKPLMPVLGEAAICRIIKLLCKNGIDECAITLKYLPQLIMDELGECRYDVNIKYFIEDEVLGTAGGVKNAVGEGEGDILVISGDCICDIDLQSVYRTHKEKNADVTIVTKRVPCPLSFGAVCSDETGRIIGFIEKPSWNGVVSDAVNTGIYILSRTALELIPKGRRYDFSLELFPRMLREGYRLYAAEGEGDWCDIGDLDSYRRCNIEALGGKYSLSEDVRAEREGCHNSVIGQGVSLGKNICITSSVLHDGVSVGDGCTITSSTVGRNTVIGSGVIIHCGCSIGEGCYIESGAEIFEDYIIGNNKTINGEVKNMKIKCGRLFSHGSLCLGDEADAASLHRLGIAFAEHIGKIGVCHDGGGECEALSESFLSGAYVGGIEGFRLGEATYGQARSANKFFSFDITAYFTECDERISVYFFDRDGLAPQKTLEDKIIKSMYSAPRKVGGHHSIKNVPLLGALYENDIKKYLPDPKLDGLRVCVAASGEGDIIRRCLSSLGAECVDISSSDSELNIVAGRDELKLSESRTSAATEELYRILGMIMMLSSGEGKELCVSCDTPPFIVELAKKSGFEVHYYLSDPVGETNKRNRAGVYNTPWCYDTVYACLLLICLMRKHSQELKTLSRRLGEISVRREIYELDEAKRGGVLARLYEERCAYQDEYTEGVRLKDELGSAQIGCVREGLCATIQAYGTEAASEFSARLKSKIERYVHR